MGQVNIIKYEGYSTILSPSWNIITVLRKLDFQTCHDPVHSSNDFRK
jgi:hypothetical protein